MSDLAKSALLAALIIFGIIGCTAIVPKPPQPDPCANAYMAYKQQLENMAACAAMRGVCTFTHEDIARLKLLEARALTECPFEVPAKP